MGGSEFRRFLICFLGIHYFCSGYYKTYDGFDNVLLDTIKQAIIGYISGFQIGQSLVVPSVYGGCYAAAGDKASTFAITDLAATSPASQGTTRIRIPADGNTLLNTAEEMIRITLVAG